MGEIFAGRYELVDPIGRGGVGAVWRVWDHRRSRYVAAKVLQQSDAHSLLRFVREQALRIDHPHVLAPTSWAADDDKVLFTMEMVRGGSLTRLVGDYGPLPPRHVCVLLDQLLAGLAAVHAEGVVHRDIKPGNLLLEATGKGQPHLRVSDFGIAMRKGEPRLTEANYVVGTPGYFAPEQVMGSEPDFTADLYAAGLVALYLLSGQKPDAEAIVERYLAQGVPPPPREVPAPLWQVVGNLLHPDPTARFRTATGTRKALAVTVELLPEPAPDEEPVEVFDQIGPLPEGFGPKGPRQVIRMPSTADSGTFVLRPSTATPLLVPERPSTPPPPATPPATPPPPPTPLSTAPPTPPPTPSPTATAAAVFEPPAQPPPTPPAALPYRAPTPAQAPDPPGRKGNPPGPVRRSGRRRRAAPRPGPSAGVVTSVLVIAALCFAMGFWALKAAG
jgi:serine/threonine protein kinase